MKHTKSGCLIYKCRLCGELQSNIHVPDVDMSIISVMNGYKLPLPIISPTDLHLCSDGKIGVCDLVGGKYDD